MTSAKIITVDFGRDTLFALESNDGVYVALKPIVVAIGLDWSAQLQRVRRDAILSEGMVIMPIPFGHGGNQEAACLRLDLLNGWLFGIEDGRIKDERARKRVLAYKRECYGVLYKHFYGRTLEDRQQDLNCKLAVSEDQPILTKRSLVTEARQTHGTQAARELWFKLGLPTTPAMYADTRQADFFYTAVRRDAGNAERQVG